jgi:hypothetical protein
MRLQRWLDHPIGKIIQIECSAHTVGKDKSRRILRLDCLEQQTERCGRPLNSSKPSVREIVINSASALLLLAILVPLGWAD